MRKILFLWHLFASGVSAPFGIHLGVTAIASYFLLAFRHAAPLFPLQYIVSKGVVVIVDENLKIVHRICISKSSNYSVTNNFTSLAIFHRVVQAPVPIKFTKISCLFTADSCLSASSESMIEFQNLDAVAVSVDKIAVVYRNLINMYSNRKIIKYDGIDQWCKSYSHIEELLPHETRLRFSLFKTALSNKLIANLSSCQFEFLCANIHGDLTFKNLWIDGQNVRFIDFDRSEFGLPEFDVYLFLSHLYFYKSKSESTFIKFSNFAAKFLNSDKFYQLVELFYSLNPVFKINDNFRSAVRALFLCRTLLYIFSESTHSDSEESQIINNFEKVNI